MVTPSVKRCRVCLITHSCHGIAALRGSAITGIVCSVSHSSSALNYVSSFEMHTAVTVRMLIRAQRGRPAVTTTIAVIAAALQR
eukprot:13623-Heterococcus_DN1.PRE.4